ncbi:hypothetical protein VUR80DRAFT_9839 [Thermomyces stellatus]
MMGICDHGPAAAKKPDIKGGNFVEEESIERRALRVWTSCWTSLLPELFGGSMSNLGAMSHASFSVAMDEFLAVFEAYVKTYLLDTAYYIPLVREHANCLPWAKKMYNAHPSGDHDEDGCGEGSCLECDCDCHETFKRALRQAGRDYEVRWEYRSRVEAMTGRRPEDLSKDELLRTVERILIDRAGVTG